MILTDRIKLLGTVAVVALVLVILWQWPITAALVGWSALGYIGWRAWPAVRSDIAGIYRRHFPVHSWRF